MPPRRTHTSYATTSSTLPFYRRYSRYPRHRRLDSAMNLFDFCVMMEDDEQYDQIMAAVFGREDLIQKVTMIRHIHRTNERLRQEIQFQMNFMEQQFGEMINSG